MDRDELAAVLLDHCEKTTDGRHVGCRCGQRPSLAAQAAGDDDMALRDWANHVADELADEVSRYLEEVIECDC